MNIIIYTKTNCSWAGAVMEFLRRKDIPFEERDIYKNEDWKKEVVDATGQSKSPTLNIDGTWLPDASVEQVNDAIKEE